MGETLLSGGGRTPKETIEALALAECEMKMCAFELSGGKELTSMDDVVPIFIFVLVRSSILHPLACAQLLHDALTKEERMTGHGKTVTILSSAARYIADSLDKDSSRIQSLGAHDSAEN